MNLPRAAGGKFAKREPQNDERPAQLALPEIVTVSPEMKNRTQAFWKKYDHLLSMEVEQGFAVDEGQQSQWAYTMREVVKDNEGRKYRFIRGREGLFLTRKS